MQSELQEEFNELNRLLSKIAIGDVKAFSTIFHRFSPKVYTYALKLVKTETLAEEITQEVFIKIWKLESKLTEIENLDAYLRVVTRNQGLKAFRRLALEARANKMRETDYKETHNETEEYIIFKDSEKILNQAIEKLPPQQKLVYQLCHQEGLKYEEVAERLNISKLTVKTHMQHALRFLRNYISTNTDISVFILLMSLLAKK